MKGKMFKLCPLCDKESDFSDIDGGITLDNTIICPECGEESNKEEWEIID